MNFWQQLQKPIIGLSPMDGVTDAPFRSITAKYGKPDVIITEFINVQAIYFGSEPLYFDFLYHEHERPVVAQIYGKEPEYFYIAAQIACELGFDGIDVNMGCPAKSVAASGSGAALIKTPQLAQEIMRVTKQGVADWVANGLPDLPEKLLQKIEATRAELMRLGVVLPQARRTIPVSVKTRVGYSEPDTENWISTLLETGPANISLHGRTLKQLYMGQADWGEIKKAAATVAAFNKTAGAEGQITILGNGDVASLQDAKVKISESGVNGVLIGRATFGNPWLFADLQKLKNGTELETKEIAVQERVDVALEHARLHEAIKPGPHFVQMRKHLGWYMKGFPGASAARAQLVRAGSVAEVEQICKTAINRQEILDKSEPTA